MIPLLVAAAVLAVVVVRMFPPQPWEHRPAPHDRIKAHSRPGVLPLVIALGTVAPGVMLYCLLIGYVGAAVVLAVYILVSVMLTEAQFLR